VPVVIEDRFPTSSKLSTVVVVAELQARLAQCASFRSSLDSSR